jgi:hypothetical protein
MLACSIDHNLDRVDNKVVEYCVISYSACLRLELFKHHTCYGASTDVRYVRRRNLQTSPRLPRSRSSPSTYTFGEDVQHDAKSEICTGHTATGPDTISGRDERGTRSLACPAPSTDPILQPVRLSGG